jgi:hypothetical protein
LLHFIRLAKAPYLLPTLLRSSLSLIAVSV